MAVGDLPQAGQLYFHNGQFLLSQLSAAKTTLYGHGGESEVVKPYLNPDSAVSFFDHYALLPPAGLIVIRTTCEADLLDLNTWELIPYGPTWASLSGARGLPMTPEKQSLVEEEPEKTATSYGKALSIYFTEDGLSLNTRL